MEARLAEWTQGGDATFFQDDDAGNASQEICFAKDEEMPAEAQERAAAIREIDNTELAKEFTGQLGTYLRNRLLKHKEDDPEQPLEEKHVKKYLEEARDKGPPEVSAEADRILGSRSWGKVGYNPEAAVLSTFRWDDGVGQASLKYRGNEWDVVNYGDKLPISKKLEDLLGPGPSQAAPQEIRQCLILHCNAGLLASQRGGYPELEALHQEASKCREEFAEQALQAMDHLGEMPEEMGRAEADVRVFVHDFLHYSHDKDYRCLAAFVPQCFEAVKFHIVRMDNQGELTVEDIYGPCHRNGKDTEVWLLVHNGHMRLLGRPKDAESPPLVREVLAAGWEVHMEAAEGPAARVRARDLQACPRCETSPEKVRRTGVAALRSHAPVFGLYPLPAAWAKTGAAPPQPVETHEYVPSKPITDEELKAWLGPQAVHFDKAVKHGLHFLEVYAGSARATDAVRELGGTAICLGLDHGQDFTRSKDRAFCQALIDRLEPSHLWLAFPCTAFCGWMRLALVRDCNLQPRLKEGRHHLQFAFGLATRQRTAGRHVHAENPLTSSAWQEPVAVKELSNVEWKRARLDQCTTGLSGPQGGLHLKPTLIRTTDPAMQAQLDRQCPRDHQHELVQGGATAASAMYSPYMARLIAEVVVPSRGGQESQTIRDVWGRTIQCRQG